MKTHLAYGKKGLDIDLPDDYQAKVVSPRFVAGMPEPRQAIRTALRTPVGTPALRDLIQPSETVGIIFSDITRPTPLKSLLPVLFEELANIPPKYITLFNALGTHRPNTEVELRQMLGDGVFDAYEIVQNDAVNERTQTKVGTSWYGNDIWLNSAMVGCDWKILTGFIEPHFFAGFSGGGKAVMPGMAGLATVLANHSNEMIASPNATWGITQGNPVWEEVQEAAHMAGRLFLLNVTLNRKKQITGVFAGELDAAHQAGCEFARQTAMVAVPHRFDIVITSNSGYPLDLNVYQSVKGMSAAAQVVKPGGAIIIAAECWDGLPEHGQYSQLLHGSGSPEHFLQTMQTKAFDIQDQWQVQIQAQIQQKADVYLYSRYLSDTQIGAAWLKPCRNIEQTVSEIQARLGGEASICVLPEGPQTIPYVHADSRGKLAYS